MGYYPTGEMVISNGFLFVRKNDNWDIFGLDGTLYSTLWKDVKIKFGDKIELDAINSLNVSLHFPVTKIKEEYNKCLDFMKLNFVDEVKKMSATNKIYGGNENRKDNSSNNIIKEDMDDFLIKFICKAPATIYNNNRILGSDKQVSFDLAAGDGIAWLHNGLLYIVSYKFKKTYTIVKEIPLSSEYYQQVTNNLLSGFTKLEKPCSMPQIVDVLSKYLKTSNAFKDNSVQTTDSEKSEEIVPMTTCADKIKNSYAYLLNVSTEDNVKEALYILFKDQIAELKGYSSSIDELIHKLSIGYTNSDEFRSDLENLIDSYFKNDSSHLEKIKLSLKFYVVVQELSFPTYLNKLFEDCPFAICLDKPIQEMIKEKTCELVQKENCKQIILDIISLLTQDVTKQSVICDCRHNLNNICDIEVEGKHLQIKLDQLIPKNDLVGNALTGKFVVKNNYIFIFI